MSASKKIGPFRVRMEVENGEETGKAFVDIPEKYSSTGKRRRRRLPDWTTAEAAAEALNKKIKKGSLQASTAPTQPVVSTSTFRKAAKDWEEQQRLKCDAGHKRSNSLETELNRLKPLTAEFGNRRLDQLEDKDVLIYQANRKKAGIRRTTINAELAVLRRVLKHGGCTHLTVQPLAGNNKPHRPPTPHEIVKIVSHLRGRVQLLVWLMAEAGLRPDEAYNATWAWFDRYESGTPRVHVQPIANAVGDELWLPKTDTSSRCVPISERLFGHIMALPRKSMWVFPSPRNPNQPIGSIRKSLFRAVEQAGVLRDGGPLYMTPKMFRKAFGTALAAAKVDRTVIQDLIGHERGSPVTDMFYIGLEDVAQHEAVRHVQLGLERATLATRGNRLDSKAALRAYLQAQLTENPG
jgi:integrase